MVPRDRISFFLFLLVFLMGVLVLLLAVSVFYNSGSFGSSGFSFSGDRLQVNTGSAVLDQISASLPVISFQKGSSQASNSSHARAITQGVKPEDLGFIIYPVVQIESNVSVVSDQETSG